MTATGQSAEQGGGVSLRAFWRTPRALQRRAASPPKKDVKCLRYASRQSRSVARSSARDDCLLTVLLAYEVQSRRVAL